MTNAPFIDGVVGLSHYKSQPNKLLVREIFITVQGEMPYAGTPSAFVRLGGCNLGDKVHCTFCDTDFMRSKSVWMTVPEILEQIYSKLSLETILNTTYREILLVITGGEPLLQSKDCLYDLCKEWPGHTQFESNGIVYVDWHTVFGSEPTSGVATNKPSLVISPKAVNGTIKANKKWLDQYTCTAIRRLVCSDPSSPYYHIDDFTNEYITQRGGMVYFSPITPYNAGKLGFAAINWPAYRANVNRATELCFEHGGKLSIQSHVFAGLE